MRIFWAVMILLVLGTVGFVIVSGGGGKPTESADAGSAAAEEGGGSSAETPPGPKREAPIEEPAQQVRAGEEIGQASETGTDVPVVAPVQAAAPTVAEIPDVPEADVTARPATEHSAPAAISGVPMAVAAEPPAEAPAETPAGSGPEESGGSGSPESPEAPRPEEISAEAAVELSQAAAEAPVKEGAEPVGDAETVPAPVAYAPDATATRTGIGMLGNVINQASTSPGSDFIGRLAAAAAAYWSPAPDVLPAFEGATRAFRVSSGPSLLIVADDGKGNNVTVVIPRADVGLVHTLLEETTQLSLPAEDAAGANPGEERFGVSVGGEAVGSLRLGPVPAALGIQGLALTFLADPVELPDPSAPVSVPDGPTYTLLEDGSIELSSGTIIRGDGSAARPYAITWELLVAAERVYQPRNGLTALPDWCRVLHEKHVRLTGHLLSPLMQDDTTQILLMRNQWDGCCIGVPPTPYDAVEVELSRPVSLVREQLNYGTITGIFEVDPYLVNNWLVGLWLLSEAKLEAANAQNWDVPAGAPN